MVDVLQIEEVAVAELRGEIEVADAPLPGEHVRVLELHRPDRVVRMGKRGGRGRVGPDEWHGGMSPAVVEAGHGVRFVVPPGVEELPAVPVRRQVAVRSVSEHVARVVEDDVEDHAHAVGVGGVHQRLQVGGRPEPRIHL